MTLNAEAREAAAYDDSTRGAMNSQSHHVGTALVGGIAQILASLVTIAVVATKL